MRSRGRGPQEGWGVERAVDAGRRLRTGTSADSRQQHVELGALRVLERAPRVVIRGVLPAQHAAAERDDPRRDGLEVLGGEVDMDACLPDLRLDHLLDAELGSALGGAQKCRRPSSTTSVTVVPVSSAQKAATAAASFASIVTAVILATGSLMGILLSWGRDTSSRRTHRHPHRGSET